MASRKVVLTRSCVAAAVAMAFSSGASALDFQVGDWKGNWSSSLSLGTSWRAKDPDPTLYGQANGALVGKTNGSGNNTIDVGNLNYGEGDTFTTQLKFITEARPGTTMTSRTRTSVSATSRTATTTTTSAPTRWATASHCRTTSSNA